MKMLSATRLASVSCISAIQTTTCLTRAFATQKTEKQIRAEEYNRQRKQYRDQVSKLRKQYAEESKELQRQLDEIRAKKVQANQEKMRRISEKKKLEHKDNERFNYEHLCNVEILKSIRQTRGVMNQFRLQRERKEHIHKMLMNHMPYVYNAYKLEEVETRVLAEMQEIVPFDRIFLAPPSGIVKDSDFLSYKDYEVIKGISIDKGVVSKHNKELYQAWKEEKEKVV